eukprot:7380107-Prymnesium_polylepis.1
MATYSFRRGEGLRGTALAVAGMSVAAAFPLRVAGCSRDGRVHARITAARPWQPELRQQPRSAYRRDWQEPWLWRITQKGTARSDQGSHQTVAWNCRFDSISAHSIGTERRLRYPAKTSSVLPDEEPADFALRLRKEIRLSCKAGVSWAVLSLISAVLSPVSRMDAVPSAKPAP